MNFFIIGDSWGVGEWRLVQQRFEPVPNTGIDYFLSQRGHSVCNVSAGSAGNFGQLRHAYWTLKNHAEKNISYDYIIWFHTESMRDIEEIVIKDPDEASKQFPEFNIRNWQSAIDYLDTQNYKYAQMLYNEFKIPFVVIGGQCPVNPSIKDFSFYKFCIESWLSELLNLDFCPPCVTFFSWEKIQRILSHYGISEKKFITENFDMLDKSQIICDKVKQHKNFPDNSHPGRTCIESLTERILSKLGHNN